MKAAVLHGYDEALAGETFVTYEDVDDPKIAAPTDVIVRVGGAGVCRTDLHIVEASGAAWSKSNFPTSWVMRMPAGSRKWAPA